MLIDTTLREGAQMFGVRLAFDDRRELAMALHAVGIEEIEAGWIGCPDLKDFCQWSGPRLGASVISIWSRCREDDVARAAALGVKRINIGVPASDEHRRKRLGVSRRALVRRMTDVVTAARSHGMEVSVGLEDASRTPKRLLTRLALAAEDAGAFRVRLSDTVGVWTPAKTMRTVDALRSVLAIDLAVHCHNDFGMGTANAVSALEAGADWADGSLLGIGERSGLAATEQLAAHSALAAKTSRYNLEGLAHACERVAELARLQILRNTPVVGSDIFSCETGLHLHGMKRDVELFEPYDPARVSGTRRLGFGQKSGAASAGDWLNHALPAEIVFMERAASSRPESTLRLTEIMEPTRN